MKPSLPLSVLRLAGLLIVLVVLVGIAAMKMSMSSRDVKAGPEPATMTSVAQTRD